MRTCGACPASAPPRRRTTSRASPRPFSLLYYLTSLGGQAVHWLAPAASRPACAAGFGRIRLYYGVCTHPPCFCAAVFIVVVFVLREFLPVYPARPAKGTEYGGVASLLLVPFCADDVRRGRHAAPRHAHFVAKKYPGRSGGGSEQKMMRLCQSTLPTNSVSTRRAHTRTQARASECTCARPRRCHDGSAFVGGNQRKPVEVVTHPCRAAPSSAKQRHLGITQSE